MYRLIPCRHGVCASPSTAVTRALRKNKSTTGIEGVILLPGGIERDILAQDESIIFPGRISLDEDDIKNLDCLNPDNFSFTHYGPDSQDKSTNQDFALSGHFTGRSGGIARFSILADGISNGFAFPQRGAQLSCFAAYHCLKALYEQFAGQDKSLNEQNIDRFRDDLTEKINQFFKFDREHLLYLFEEDDREPPHIGPKAWQKYFKEKPEKWYGNTLLISFLSSFGGFLIYAGDGGIIVLKGQKPPKEIMRSSESPAVERFAAMGVTPAAFLGALIGRDPADGFVEIISVTDGIDRTWQTNEMDLARAFSAKASLAGLIDKIAHLQDRIPGGDIDVDNYSIGRVFLPFSAAPHSRMTGGAKPVPVSKSLLKPALEESQVDSDRIEAAAPQKKKPRHEKNRPHSNSSGSCPWGGAQQRVDNRTSKDPQHESPAGSALNREISASEGAKAGASNFGEGIVKTGGESGYTGASRGSPNVTSSGSAPKSNNTTLGGSVIKGGESGSKPGAGGGSAP